jgi:hypothetical protein
MAKIYDFKSKQLIYEEIIDNSNPYSGMDYEVLFKEVNVFYELKKSKGLNINLIEKAIPLFKEFSKAAKNPKIKEQAENALHFLESELEVKRVKS